MKSMDASDSAAKSTSEARDQSTPALEAAVRFFTRETRIMDGLAVACGAGDSRLSAMDGREISSRTLFDLASVTKIFTGLCLSRLWEMGILDPFRRVTWYCPEFTGLSAVTVEQLMAFQVEIRTPVRLDSVQDRDAALQSLRGAFVAEKPGPRAYSDIPAMVLKYVIEQVAAQPLMASVRQMILRPAGMTETFARVPADRLSDCLLYGPEYRIEGENWICRQDPRRGVPHDPKAALLQGNSDDLCGHAGLFSTLSDMEKLARALLEGKIISPASLARLAVNRTGRQRPDGSYTQYLGYLCYRKHPDQYFSEVPEDMSSSAIGISGFTGNHFSLDPARRRYTLFLGNRVRDRLTMLLPPPGRSRQDYGLSPDGTGILRWRDGSLHPSSVDYVHQKDAHLHAVIAAWARKQDI